LAKRSYFSLGPAENCFWRRSLVANRIDCREQRSVNKMAHGQTLAKCFAHFGAVCASRRFSKSAVTQDGQTVVVAMWEDEVQRLGDRVVYESRYKPRLKGKVRGVDSELIANLKWARDHCFGLVRVVMLAAEDVTAEPRKIACCYPNDSLVMRITGFDSHTRTFRAESV
jgi:hypothetical protein